MELAGIAGVAWAGALAHFLALVVPAMVLAPRRIRSLGQGRPGPVMMASPESEAEERVTR
jgi:hypothetical protein